MIAACVPHAGPVVFWPVMGSTSDETRTGEWLPSSDGLHYFKAGRKYVNVADHVGCAVGRHHAGQTCLAPGI